MLPSFEVYRLEDGCEFYAGSLPSELSAEEFDFEQLWNLHPDEYHEIEIHGRRVKTPRWQQAYGTDYHYTGRVNRALPIPEQLKATLSWAQAEIAKPLNGMLLNWYDGALGHYIGKHRDSIRHMVAGSPIVTISLGQHRTFRLRGWRQPGRHDFEASHGTVFVMPYATNLAWTHEVPKSARLRKRRISITLRALEPPS